MYKNEQGELPEWMRIKAFSEYRTYKQRDEADYYKFMESLTEEELDDIRNSRRKIEKTKEGVRFLVNKLIVD